MGIRFIPLHLEHLAELDFYHPAEIYFEYLVICSKNPYTQKDSDGFFMRSVSEIEREIHYKKSVQNKARALLIKNKWIECRLKSQRSPTVNFRIEKRGRL